MEDFTPGYDYNNDMLQYLALLSAGAILDEDEYPMPKPRYQESEEEIIRKIKFREEHEQ